MVNQRRFSLSFVVFFPLVLFIVVMLVTTKNYYDAVNRYIDTEYSRIDRALTRGIKVLTALDYSFTNYSNFANPLSEEHNSIVKGDICYIWPIDVLLLENVYSDGLPAVDVDYMIVGEKSLCQAGTKINKLAEQKAGFAPSLSFLHDIESHIVGIHYIDKRGYVISSPDKYAKNFTKELWSTLKARPFWQKTAQDKVNITLAGPGPMLDSMEGQIISLTVPIYEKGVHQGVLSIDFDVDALLTTSENLVGKLHLVSNFQTIPEDAVRLKPIEKERLSANHSIYYEYNLWSEIKNLTFFEKYSIMVAVFIYVLSTVVLFYVNMHTERRYFKDLAARDPMTGLLNRRGMQAVWRNKMTKKNVALAVFDIDNFKTINDTYGHDVGDSAIQLVAKCIRDNIRHSDVASRFGGEEFILAIYDEDIEGMKHILERVKKAIDERSRRVTKNGFTVSGSVVFSSASKAESFDELFKAADEKLYEAKSTGKNKICY
ncbi:GGDEF domain-containing protein [Vibrio sp. VP6]|uniref:sensor domain-containing diguanylate cyclase n=1 Tax=Vibrio sp. VP6 TaxID=2992766 RepID=UPI00237C42FF|nr:GGDEF domain-containing protein [Vibrio sp. VP6]MDE0549728.1 GGDEF domain-containing protein [Vibrio sp. VP6]